MARNGGAEDDTGSGAGFSVKVVDISPIEPFVARPVSPLIPDSTEATHL